MCTTKDVLLDNNKRVVFEFTYTNTLGNAKIESAPNRAGSRALTFARIPYHEVNRNLASAEGASEETLAMF